MQVCAMKHMPTATINADDDVEVVLYMFVWMLSLNLF
jgi:hypothetical protein